MIVHLDTSALVDALTGPRRPLSALTTLVKQGHPMAISSPVLSEWKRRPESRAELAAQEAWLPTESVVAFDGAAAALAADLYGRLSRPRSREIDIAIAATAMHQGALLWTLNYGDFEGIPGRRLV